jgi:hypothetical protein
MIKRFFKFIKERVFNIKPFFKIKIEQSWFSERYYCIKFSNNNGHKWEYILCDVHDFDTTHPNGLKMEPAYINAADVVQFAKEFKTYDDCVKYNAKVAEKVFKNNQIEYESYEKGMTRCKNDIEAFNKR